MTKGALPSLHPSSFLLHPSFDTLSAALLRSGRSFAHTPSARASSDALSLAAATPALQVAAGDGPRVRPSRALARPRLAGGARRRGGVSGAQTLRAEL